jgi:hypothetical protein
MSSSPVRNEPRRDDLGHAVVGVMSPERVELALEGLGGLRMREGERVFDYPLDCSIRVRAAV